ncbi:helix-turn-helix transcriptional regulator [Xanthobacteraceae bacterium Astr-EGSB]|uniref:helix-turn-helix domain-containing protein n=1 Tax=Astrobacterium formosum TaxID=3069710 RepID=UPI0027B55157|nr:helix-turn-helix transcriptional regulator [Xanthobacteraceae bacterium Astr-EGSB]
MFTFCENVNVHAMAIDGPDTFRHPPVMAKVSPRRYTDIGNRLIALREALEMKQVDICREIKVSANRWSQYESGERRITLPVAQKLKKSYGASLDWLYEGDAGGLPAQLRSKLLRAA